MDGTLFVEDFRGLMMFDLDPHFHKWTGWWTWYLQPFLEPFKHPPIYDKEKCDLKNDQFTQFLLTWVNIFKIVINMLIF